MEQAAPPEENVCLGADEDGILDQIPIRSIGPVSTPAGPLQSGLPTSAGPSSSQSAALAVTQAAPASENAEASTGNTLAGKRRLPQGTLQDLLEEAGLSQYTYCEAITAQGYSCALDLAEASPAELAQLMLDLESTPSQLRPPEGRRLHKLLQTLARPQ